MPLESGVQEPGAGQQPDKNPASKDTGSAGGPDVPVVDYNDITIPPISEGGSLVRQDNPVGGERTEGSSLERQGEDIRLLRQQVLDLQVIVVRQGINGSETATRQSQTERELSAVKRKLEETKAKLEIAHGALGEEVPNFAEKKAVKTRLRDFGQKLKLSRGEMVEKIGKQMEHYGFYGLGTKGRVALATLIGASAIFGGYELWQGIQDAGYLPELASRVVGAEIRIPLDAEKLKPTIDFSSSGLQGIGDVFDREKLTEAFKKSIHIPDYGKEIGGSFQAREGSIKAAADALGQRYQQMIDHAIHGIEGVGVAIGSPLTYLLSKRPAGLIGKGVSRLGEGMQKLEKPKPEDPGTGISKRET